MIEMIFKNFILLRSNAVIGTQNTMELFIECLFNGKAFFTISMNTTVGQLYVFTDQFLRMNMISISWKKTISVLSSCFARQATIHNKQQFLTNYKVFDKTFPNNADYFFSRRKLFECIKHCSFRKLEYKLSKIRYQC